MRNKIMTFIWVSIVAMGAMSVASLSPVSVAHASAQPATNVAVCISDQSIFGFSPWYACLPGAEDGEPRIESLNDIFLIIFPLLESLIKAGAYVAAGFIFYSLINFITARGNAGKAAKAIEGIRDAVIGFVITLIAIAIVNFVAGAFTAG